MSTAKGCPRLSVAMIVRDAEDCLAATLDCVRNLADEIIVVDTGSRDATVRIARQKATTVLSRTWNDDFAAARNEALSAATGDWILWLDAGETLSLETAESLRKFVDHEADAAIAYWLMVRTPPQGINIAGEQAARLRLHPRVAGLTFAGRVRESLEPALAGLAMQTAELPLVIERGPREHDPEVRRRRAERNLHLATLAIGEQGPTARWLNCLGEATQALGDNVAALTWHKQALEKSAPASSDMLEAFYGILTALEGHDDNRESQLQLCMKALEVFPLDAQLLCAIGGYLQSRDLLELASRSYHIAAEHGQTLPDIWHLEGLREIAVNCYALTLQLLERDDEAREVLEKELAANPTAARIRRQLLELHVRHARREEALAVVSGIPRSVPNREALRSAVRGACLAAEANWIAARSYLETAYKAGCREPLCLRWLTATYLGAGQRDQAFQMLAEWSRVDPLSPELRQYRLALAPPRPADRTLRVDEEKPAAIPAPVAPLAASSPRTPA